MTRENIFTGLKEILRELGFAGADIDQLVASRTVVVDGAGPTP